jgi:hypothetical protein
MARPSGEVPDEAAGHGIVHIQCPGGLVSIGRSPPVPREIRRHFDDPKSAAKALNALLIGISTIRQMRAGYRDDLHQAL